MKYFLIILLLFFASIKLFSQPDLPEIKDQYVLKGNIIKTNFLPMWWGPIPLTAEYRLNFERLISPKTSVDVIASYLDKSWIFAMIEDTMSNSSDKIYVRGFRGALGFKYYLSKNKNAPAGVYMMPQFSYSKAKFFDEKPNTATYYLQGTHLDFNFLLGYQIIADNKWALDVFTGIGYRHPVWIEYDNGVITKAKDMQDLYLIFSPIRYKIGFNVGFIF